METAAAMEALRMKLEATFGKAMAMMILATACRTAQVPTGGLSPDEFRRLVEATCRDQRVIDMWGSAGAADMTVQMTQMVA